MVIAVNLYACRISRLEQLRTSPRRSSDEDDSEIENRTYTNSERELGEEDERQ